MKPTVYVETSVISYLAARPSRNVVVAAHQQLSLEWWTRRRSDVDACVSVAVIREIASGDRAAAARRLALAQQLRLLEPSDTAFALAARLARELQLPPRAELDALHVTTAATSGATLLLTWNCRHLAGPTPRQRVQSFCSAHGLTAPSICTPMEDLPQ